MPQKIPSSSANVLAHSVYGTEHTGAPVRPDRDTDVDSDDPNRIWSEMCAEGAGCWISGLRRRRDQSIPRIDR